MSRDRSRPRQANPPWPLLFPVRVPPPPHWAWPRPRPLSPSGGGRPLASLRLDQRGQATAEYALVLLAAAAVAGLLLAWATSTDAIGRLMDAVIGRLIGEV